MSYSQVEETILDTLMQWYEDNRANDDAMVSGSQ